MSSPFTDAPLGCHLGAHEWRTTWIDQEGPMPVCASCGSTEGPMDRERRRFRQALRDVAGRFR